MITAYGVGNISLEISSAKPYNSQICRASLPALCKGGRHGVSRDGRVDKNIKHIELFILYEMQL
jgi:hypothetical protein